MQALDRLTSFKVMHKKRVWQDRRKADWQEEDTQLKRASKELTKSIQVVYNRKQLKKETLQAEIPFAAA